MYVNAETMTSNFVLALQLLTCIAHKHTQTWLLSPIPEQHHGPGVLLTQAPSGVFPDVELWD